MTVRNADPPLCPGDAVPVLLLAAPSLVRPLLTLAIATAGAMTACFALARSPWFALLRPLGTTGLVRGALLLALYGLCACLGMAVLRSRSLSSLRGVSGGSKHRPTSAWLHTILALVLIGSATFVLIAGWPVRQAAAAMASSSNEFPIAAAMALLTIPFLLAERYIGTIGDDRLPEADDLRALLFLPVFALSAEAMLQIAGAAGFGTLYPARVALALALLGVGAELFLRRLATWFLPPAEIMVARATIGSAIAAILCGRALSPSRVSGVIRSQLGMDFSRSWALRFMRGAALPVILLMASFCWFLTGVTRIDLNERGSYERFGIATAMLTPGLHMVLPWPFGIVRHVELGVVHAVSISYGQGGTAADVSDHSTAEGTPPASANELWDSEPPTNVSYVIASGEQDMQSFQTVSASVRVLYRTGHTDAAARAALYNETAPADLVHALAGRLLAQFFAARTLPSVLGENHGKIAGDLQNRLQLALDRLDTGIDIVSVIIEAIHPPSGAAVSYRNVQAAEIAATTDIASERGRAETTRSVAATSAHNAMDDAQGTAAEAVTAAQKDMIDINADEQPFHAAPEPFLMERYFASIRAALKGIPLEIVDHRLNGTSLPTIDLRPPSAPNDGYDLKASRMENRP